MSEKDLDVANSKAELVRTVLAAAAVTTNLLVAARVFGFL